MVEWLAGKRMKGTSSERTSLSTTVLGGTGVGGWVELGRSTSSTPSVSSLPNKRYYMVLSFMNPTSATQNHNLRFNSDPNNNYAWGFSRNGGSYSGGGTLPYALLHSDGVSAVDGFNVTYIANKSDEEKLMVNNSCYSDATGAGYYPDRVESCCKWTNSSDAIHTITAYSTGGNWGAGGEMIVLGYDPADTHTTNFWQELANVNADGSSTTLSSGTITGKKYLWIQCYTEGTSADIYTNFNDVTTGSQYNRRYSINNGSDSFNGSQNFISNMHNAGRAGEEAFSNWFIFNNDTNEKLILGQSVQSGGAGNNSPHSFEFVNKWANTTDQITKINFVSQTGNFGTNSWLRVWGAD